MVATIAFAAHHPHLHPHPHVTPTPTPATATDNAASDPARRLLRPDEPAEHPHGARSTTLSPTSAIPTSTLPAADRQLDNPRR